MRRVEPRGCERSKSINRASVVSVRGHVHDRLEEEHVCIEVGIAATASDDVSVALF